MSDYFRHNATISKFSDNESWVILSEIEQRIKEKIEAVGTPLKDWDINIYRGILTGFNEAFIISSEKREEILNNCITEDERQKTDEIIRPLLRGRDIKRYSYHFADLYLICTFPSLKIDIELYPTVKQHLLSFGYDRLKQTGEKGARKKTNNKWFETQDSISYWEEFSKQKIVYIEIMTDNPEQGYHFPCFSFDTQNCVALNTAYIMTGENIILKYILGVLNSKVGKLLVKLYVTQLQQRQFRMLNQYVVKFPIPKPSGNKLEIITNNVNIIMDGNVDSIKINEAQNSLNKSIYELFQFDDIDIAFIENL